MPGWFASSDLLQMMSIVFDVMTQVQKIIYIDKHFRLIEKGVDGVRVHSQYCIHTKVIGTYDLKNIL